MATPRKPRQSATQKAELHVQRYERAVIILAFEVEAGRTDPLYSEAELQVVADMLERTVGSGIRIGKNFHVGASRAVIVGRVDYVPDAITV